MKQSESIKYVNAYITLQKGGKTRMMHDTYSFLIGPKKYYAHLWLAINALDLEKVFL